MSSEKTTSVSDVWAARFDDRDDEDLACERWALRLAIRDKAMAQPVSNVSLPDSMSAGSDANSAAVEGKPQ